MPKDKISAAKFLHGTQQEKMEFVTALTEALKKNGWAVLTDLGLESKEVDEMFQWVSRWLVIIDINLLNMLVPKNKRLFDAPKDWTVKNRVTGTNGLTPDRATGPASRGYGAVNSEKIWKLKSENSFKESQRQDLKVCMFTHSSMSTFDDVFSLFRNSLTWDPRTTPSIPPPFPQSPSCQDSQTL